MKPKITIALIISTYNWPEALELVLLSVQKQSIMPNEILIADDGSHKRTKDLIEAFKAKVGFSISHIWHEDTGFKRSEIINKAIAGSSSDYIIQIDGDCFLHENFIEDHINNIEENLHLFGTRVRIKQHFVKKLISSKKISISFFHLGIKKRMRNIHLPLIARFYNKQEEISPKLRGCNLSFWKKDFILVNGYNEDIKGWGREDSELIIRLHNNGLLGKRLKFCAIVYHLDHDEENQTNLKTNNKIQEGTIEKQIKFCKNGVNKYLVQP